MKRVLLPAPGQAFALARSGFILRAVRLLPSLIFISSGGKIKKQRIFAGNRTSCLDAAKIYVIVVQ